MSISWEIPRLRFFLYTLYIYMCLVTQSLCYIVTQSLHVLHCDTIIVLHCDQVLHCDTIIQYIFASMCMWSYDNNELLLLLLLFMLFLFLSVLLLLLFVCCCCCFCYCCHLSVVAVTVAFVVASGLRTMLTSCFKSTVHL